MNDEKLSYLLFGEKKNSQALIRIPQDNHSSQQANYYWIDLKKCLGKGGYGTVYSARQVDSKGNLKDYFVAKLFKFFMYEKGKTNKGIILEVNKEIEAICNTEYKNTKNYYPKIEKPVVLPQDGMLLLSPYLGLPFDNKDVQNELKKFGFKEWNDMEADKDLTFIRADKRYTALIKKYKK